MYLVICIKWADIVLKQVDITHNAIAKVLHLKKKISLQTIVACIFYNELQITYFFFSYRWQTDFQLMKYSKTDYGRY